MQNLQNINRSMDAALLAVLLLLDPERGADQANRGFDSLQDQVSAGIRAQPTPAGHVTAVRMLTAATAAIAAGILTAVWLTS